MVVFAFNVYNGALTDWLNSVLAEKSKGQKVEKSKIYEMCEFCCIKPINYIPINGTFRSFDLRPLTNIYLLKRQHHIPGGLTVLDEQQNLSFIFGLPYLLLKFLN